MSNPEILSLVRGIVCALVDSPAEVEVSAHHLPTLTIRVKVGAADVGKVIGKQGRTARSIRVILQALAAKLKFPIHLDIAPAPIPESGIEKVAA